MWLVGIAEKSQMEGSPVLYFPQSSLNASERICSEGLSAICSILLPSHCIEDDILKQIQAFFILFTRQLEPPGPAIQLTSSHGLRVRHSSAAGLNLHGQWISVLEFKFAVTVAVRLGGQDPLQFKFWDSDSHQPVLKAYQKWCIKCKMKCSHLTSTQKMLW